MGKEKYKHVGLFTGRLLIFSLPVMMMFVWAAYKAGNKTDDYYPKLISAKQTSLIIGTSRAEQCLIPEIMDKIFADSGKKICLYNYAFNLKISPFGKAYLTSIKQKFDTASHHGLFIICVDPWSVSIEKNETDDDKGQEENAESNPLNVSNSNINPNFEYLFKHYDQPWGKILVNAYSNNNPEVIHPDGWLELNLNMDSALNAKRTYNRTKIYREEMAFKYKFSYSRFSYLEQTIQYFKQHGKVVLVRLPVSKPIYEVENKYMPDFEEKIQILSKQFDVPYEMYADTGDQYLFTDGNHMYKQCGKIFSALLAKNILANKILN